MTIALWVAQTLLLAIFFITGSIKLTQPRLELASGPMRWATRVSNAGFRTIGALELLGRWACSWPRPSTRRSSAR